jgi:hypothetical protein
LYRDSRFEEDEVIEIQNIEDLHPLQPRNETQCPTMSPEVEDVGTSTGEEPKLNLFKRLILHLFGQTYLEHRTRPGLKGSLPFYAFVCPFHGVVVDYPHVYSQRLECPKCIREEDLLKKFTYEIARDLGKNA